MDDDPERTPRASGTWQAQTENLHLSAYQMREAALKAIDRCDFAFCVEARRLQLKGEELAEQSIDWKRLAPDNEHRLAALTNIFAFRAQVEALLKGET